MFRQSRDTARLLSSLVHQKPVALFLRDRQNGNYETRADYHFGDDFTSANAPPNTHPVSETVTTDTSVPDGRTSGMKEGSGLRLEELATDIVNCQDKTTEVLSAGVSLKKFPPEPPVGCCMSGCPNCVWIQFAAEMTEHFSDGGERAQKLIQEIDDPSMKAFLMLELDRMQKSS